MNIRLVGVDADGREIEDDDHPDLLPVDHVELDAVPRIGDAVMFYNTGDHHYDGKVVGVTWMIAPDGRPGSDGYGHPCVLIQRKHG